MGSEGEEFLNPSGNSPRNNKQDDINQINTKQK